MDTIVRRTIGMKALLLIVALAGCAPQYSEEIRGALGRAYAGFDGYSFRGTPVGNFGVGTMYLKDVTYDPRHVERSWLIGHPDTWFRDDVSADERAALSTRIFVPGPLGAAQLQESISTRLGLDVAMPVIKQVLGAGAKVELERGVSVTLTASRAINRRMNWTEFTTAIRRNKIKPELVDHVGRRNYVIGAADIVLSGYKARVTVDGKVNADLHAKLSKAVGTIVGKDAGLAARISRTADGTFEIEAVDSVVAAVLYKEPPAPPLGVGAFGKVVEVDVDEWSTVKIDTKVLRPLEELLSGIAAVR